MSQSDKSTLIQRELRKAGQLIKEDGTALGSVASEALTSGAYVYPIRGVLYFLTHRQLWMSVAPIVYKSVIMSGVVVVAMFLFTYLPQVAVLAFVTGPLAFIAAVPAVLAESYVLITFLSRTFLTPQARLAVFDAVLAERGCDSLVEKGRSVKKTSGGGMVLGKVLKPIGSKFSTEGLIRYLITLPLNAIPGVGTAFFLLYNGQHSGPAAHDRYFQLQGLSKSDADAYVSQNRGAYTSFGVTSLVLGMIPIVGQFFAFSNAAGAALWAADLEKRKGRGGAGSSGQEGSKVEIGRDAEEL